MPCCSFASTHSWSPSFLLSGTTSIYRWMMWVVVVLVTAVSVVGCYAPPDFAARLTIVTSCSVAAVVMLTVLVEKTMNHDGGVWRDDKYRRAVTGTGGKLFCMFCPSVFWAEALATGFDICGMDGGGLPCLLAVQQPSKSPHRPKFRSSCQTPRPRWLQLLRRAAFIQLLLLWWMMRRMILL